MRLDQNSTISLTQTPDETIVEFFQDEAPQLEREVQQCGAGYFISRFPKKLRVNAPYLNAAVEGTEFQVALKCDTTELAVLEGAVRADTVQAGNSRVVSSGEALATGATSPGVFTMLVKPWNAAQWMLYYPPVSTMPTTAVPTTAECRATQATTDRSSCLTRRAEHLLRFGRSEAALASLDEALLLDPSNSDANALHAIIQIATNNGATAAEYARNATASPDSYRGWLALSYAHQSAFELEEALKTAERARALAPDESLTHSRVAELLLALGETKEAEKAAREALRVNPSDARAHTMLGFTHLAQIDTAAARADFEAAIASDSFEPLPRLGLGLAHIRKGRLKAGREQLEIAVALDPSNAHLRSYVGKAYYEENSKPRDELAATQLDLAKQLDPNDPTPWFYSALLKDAQTQPVSALRELDKSTDLNDNRAVYRSRLLLDQDLAARSASQATVYNELGFYQLGQRRAADSLAANPGDGSAHRFLADANASLPRRQIARASELLQAQLRQPLGAPPLQPQLANDVAFKSAFFGPATVGLNEFNPLFIQDGQNVQLFGVAGSDDTIGDQVIFNALRGPVSLSLSQFVLDSDGFRDNNQDRQEQYDGFVQTQLGEGTSVQVEATSEKRNSGDLQTAFDPEFFFTNVRNRNDVDTQRLGLRQILNARSDLLISVVRQDQQASTQFRDPFFPLAINVDQTSWKAEAQYLAALKNATVLVGASEFRGDTDEALTSPFFDVASDFSPHHVNAYSYLYLGSHDNWPMVQLGVSYDALHSDVGDQDEINPKVGVIWKPSEKLTLRAAGFGVLKRRISSDQGLEPTQVAGFNQFFDDQNGTESEVGALGVDVSLTETLAVGLEASLRDLKVPFFDGATGDVAFQYQTEKSFVGYLYWLASDHCSVSVQPAYQDFDDGATFEALELTELPLAARYFFESGLWIGVSLTGVNQTGEFSGPTGDEKGSDDFWLVDATIAYRLPRRLGTISLQATNLFDEEFQFQEVDQLVAPRYVPELQLLLRASINL